MKNIFPVKKTPQKEVETQVSADEAASAESTFSPQDSACAEESTPAEKNIPGEPTPLTDSEPNSEGSSASAAVSAVEITPSTEKPSSEIKTNREKVSLIALLAFGVLFLILLLWSLFGNYQPVAQHATYSDLINTKEISNLSVSEFVYNGIAQTYKTNGDHDYNVLYKSAVKVSVNADGIGYEVDEEKKIVKFSFPEFTIENPVIDVASISIIPDRNDLYPDDLIRLCRADALSEAKKSDKLISSARENLESIMEAWYTPVFDGYSFDYQFGVAEGGDGE